jgi:uncharacterized tellurite resistance protein B-like protein
MLPAIRKTVSAIEIPQSQIKNASEANQFALNHYALAIAAKLCGCDGEVNAIEKRSFLSLFPFFGQQHLSLLKETSIDNSSVYINCKRFNKFANDNITITAKLYAKLFKLACTDDKLNTIEISYLEKLASMLGLSKILLEKALEYYFLKDVLEIRKFNDKAEAKNYYRAEIFKLHPDYFLGDNILSSKIKLKIIDLATERARILNENYRKSIC